MRTIERTTQFKKDYKREAKGQRRATLAQDFLSMVNALAEDQPLAERHHDHALAGEWKDHRDCHIKPDLCSSIASRMGEDCSSSVSARMRS